MNPIASVIIPAHNEATVIGYCLDALLADIDPGELDVVVVCNGCTDDTAAVAEGHWGHVRVLSTAQGSKPLALNIGDDAARTFPRLYLDADVMLETDSLRRIVNALEQDDLLAASARIAVDVAGSSWPVRAYHRIWTRLPVIQEGILGRGIYAVSEKGRRRFERFPTIVADDYFVHSLFASSERHAVGEAQVLVRAPATTLGLVRRKARVFAGNVELRRSPANGVQCEPPSPTGWVAVLRSDWRLLPDAIAYALITAAAKSLSRWRLLRGCPNWSRDPSSREVDRARDVQ